LDTKQTKQNIQQMIDLARHSDIQVVMIGVPEFGLFLNSSPIYQMLAEENHIPIENKILGDILSNNSLKSDHIHPNMQGYQLIAEHIATLLSQSGAI
jgi:lysophospholipase L1-like esterase